jgi:hypothetical protein
VTFEEPTADERELAMRFPCGCTAAPGVSKATRRELLGQAMDLNSPMWVLAACRARGLRRTAKLQTGGEAGSRGAPANFAVSLAEGGARGGGRVSPSPQSVGGRAEARGVGPAATGQGAGDARGGGRVSPSRQPVGGRAEARGVGLLPQGKGQGVLAASAV